MDWRGRSIEERSGSESQECSPGRFVAHTERMSRMKKSSRFWWLHGAILLAAAVGCKNCGSGGCSTTQGGVPAGGPTYTNATGPAITGAGSATMYQSGATPSYPSMGGSANYTPGMGGGFPAPTTSSSVYPGMTGTR